MMRNTNRAPSILLAATALAFALIGCGSGTEPMDGARAESQAVGASTAVPGPDGSYQCSVANAQTCTSSTTGQIAFTCVSSAGDPTVTLNLYRGVGSPSKAVQMATSYGGSRTTVDDTYTVTTSQQPFTYMICSWNASTMAQTCGASFSVNAYLTDCVVTPPPADAGADCPRGDVWNPVLGRCVWTCGTAACNCRASGGAWDGKTCE
jgi:hypothetical protein